MMRENVVEPLKTQCKCQTNPHSRSRSISATSIGIKRLKKGSSTLFAAMTISCIPKIQLQRRPIVKRSKIRFEEARKHTQLSPLRVKDQPLQRTRLQLFQVHHLGSPKRSPTSRRWRRLQTKRRVVCKPQPFHLCPHRLSCHRLRCQALVARRPRQNNLSEITTQDCQCSQ